MTDTETLKTGLVYLACGAFAAIGILGFATGDYRRGVASIMLALANALLLL